MSVAVLFCFVFGCWSKLSIWCKNLKKNANFLELRKQQQQQKTNSPGEKKHLIENYIHNKFFNDKIYIFFIRSQHVAQKESERKKS